MIPLDPETARQAAEAWQTLARDWIEVGKVRLVAAGDALAELVLLDQLAKAQEGHPDAWYYEALQEVKAERDALGERCRQLETALGSLIGWIVGSDCYKHLPDEALKSARAALGDPPPIIGVTPDTLGFHKAAPLVDQEETK